MIKKKFIKEHNKEAMLQGNHRIIKSHNLTLITILKFVYLLKNVFTLSKSIEYFNLGRIGLGIKIKEANYHKRNLGEWIKSLCLSPL